MTIALYATGPNGEFGFKNGLPWSCKADMARFKAITMDQGVIACGLNTFESMGPLEGRKLIVVTSKSHLHKHRDTFISSSTSVIFRDLDHTMHLSNCFIGGAKLLQSIWPSVHKVYRSRIHQGIGELECDVRFNPNLGAFTEVYAEKHEDHYFQVLRRD